MLEYFMSVSTQLRMYMLIDVCELIDKFVSLFCCDQIFNYQWRGDWQTVQTSVATLLDNIMYLQKINVTNDLSSWVGPVMEVFNANFMSEL